MSIVDPKFEHLDSSSISQETVQKDVEIDEKTLSEIDSGRRYGWKTKWKLRLGKLFCPAIESRLATSVEERRFVRKLDVILMTYGCVAYCIKSIDQSNYLNAYVSGMKEDLHMYGNELNLLGTFFAVGYACALIPSQIIITKVKANYMLPPLECIWGVLTASCALVPSVKGMYGLRFGIGAAEASAWPGMLTVFMNWYTPTEFATRAALLAASGSAGSMLSGALQAGFYKTLNGAHGIPGWRWMFIINGVMTVAISLLGYAAIPDPHRGAFWISSEELKIGQSRMERVGRRTKEDFTLRTFKEVFSDYRVWLFLSLYGFKALAQKATSYFNLFIQSITLADGVTHKYSVEQVNYITMAGPATEIVAVIFYSRLADVTVLGPGLIGFQLGISAFALAVLSAWPPSIALKFAAYILLFSTTSITPILMSWMACVWKEYPARRALITGLVVLISYVSESWMVVVLWPATQAPHYHVGFKVALGFVCLSFLSLLAFYREVRS